MNDPKIFDKAGETWVLDKRRKKLRRIVQDIVVKGSRFGKGEEVYYDGGMFVVKAKVIGKVGDNYEIETSNQRLIVPRETLFKEEDLYE